MTLDILDIYDTDSLEFRVVVRVSDGDDTTGPGEIKDLSQATAEAAIVLRDGEALQAICEIDEPKTQGAINVFFPEGSFLGRPGKYTCLVRVKEPLQRGQTVKVLRLNVRASG